MTTPHQPRAHATTPTHRPNPNQHQPDPATPNTATPTATSTPHQPRRTHPTKNDSAPQPSTEELADYIRQVVNSAPAPTPALLERLAQLLPNQSQRSTK